MNAKTLGAFLVALLVQGCIIVKDGGGGGGGGGNPPPPAQPGDVTFTWSFSGGTCMDVPDVKSVHISIPGEELQNGGYYPCLANNYPGIVLFDFAPGTYSFDIEAVSYSDTVIYIGSGTFTVNGDRRVDIDLTPVGGPNSYAYLTWRFPANSAHQNPTCTQAGVSFVDVSIDGSQYERFNCEQGFTQPGVTTPYLTAGMHNISIVAVNADGYPYYRFDGSLQTFSGNPVGAHYDLGWAVGGAAIGWQLTNNQVAQTCAQAGVTDVYINFRDSQGMWVYPGAGDKHACASAPVLYSYLLPGTYAVAIQASGTNGNYESNMQNPPTVTVTAGVFPASNQAVMVQMFRF